MTASLFPALLSQRARAADVSPIAAASAQAARLRAEGCSIVTLTSGEPDFDTPSELKQAAVAALQAGQTKYTPTAGTWALREAVARGYGARHDLRYEARNVLVSNGGKQVIYLAFNATLDPGDEAIVPAPYWPTFPDSVRINGGTPVIVPTRAQEGFKLTPAGLRQALSPRTRWLVLNSPANPTGAVYSAAELAALAAVLRQHPDVLVLWDELYGEVWFGEPPAHWLTVAPDFQGRTLLVNGVSKAYAMTGWRIGWGTGPAGLIAALEAVHAGETVISDPPQRARSVTGLDWPGRREGLTDREAEILALITQGKSNAEVAALTFLSPNTVKSYIRSIYRKIDVASRTQAVLWGIDNGFAPDHHRIDHWRGGP